MMRNGKRKKENEDSISKELLKEITDSIFFEVIWVHNNIYPKFNNSFDKENNRK